MNEVAEAIGGRAIGMFRPSVERLDRLGVWFQSEYRSLLRFATFVAGDRTAAEDLVQDTFVRLYRASARLEGTTLGAYARATIVNLARSGFRRRAVERAHAISDPPAASGVADVEARDEVWSALLTLSPRQRACIALRYYEDMTERDVAATLGMSVGSVKKHTGRAMTKLRTTLGRQS